MPKLKFLVVEDDLFYQTYVNDLLAETGVDIINASDGEAGLALATSERPDLIITDIEIPKIQGFVFFKMLREKPETKDIPVIMMSGKVEKALLDRHASLSVHADGYLVKPFSGQVLIDMIRDLIVDDFGFSEVVLAPDEGEGENRRTETEKEALTDPGRSRNGEPAPSAEGTGIKVLVVDDSRYICDICRDFLEEMGAQVSTASDGETGYEKACAILPDLVLLDVQMPQMNGFVVCEMLRKNEKTARVPVILMSAVVDDDSFQRHSKLRYHADAYLPKPFMKSELEELVRRFTGLGKPDTESVYTDIESKTGFVVPSEEPDVSGDAGAEAPAADQGLRRELEEARTGMQALAEREAQLQSDLKRLLGEKEQLEAETFELRKSVEGRVGGLQDKLTLVTQRYDEARAESERLVEENQAILKKLDNASAQGEKLAELEKKLEEAGSNEELKARITELGDELQETKDTALEMEERNRLLEKEVKALKDHGAIAEKEDGAHSDREGLIKEIEGLRRDLTAATAAKAEIEDQARSLLESALENGEAGISKEESDRLREENERFRKASAVSERNLERIDSLTVQLEGEREISEKLRARLSSVSARTEAELATLEEKLSAAVDRADGLEKEKRELARSLEALAGSEGENAALQKQIEDLNRELGESRKMASDETQARMDIEGDLETAAREREFLQKELDEARRQIDDLEGRSEAFVEMEKKLEGLEKDNTQLRDGLREARKRCEHLEEALERNELQPDNTAFQEIAADHWNDRFSRLEDTLDKTVREAQVVLKAQKDRESALEESVESLVKSLEEERKAFRKERQDWRTREDELKGAFEDALREGRRLMGEEVGRFYPMHVPGRGKPLEVVTRTNRYAIAAAAFVAALILFGGGYMLSIQKDPAPVGTVTPSRDRVTAGGREATASRPPETWITRSGPEEAYEELWRKNTVQSVSDDMMIQATLHTREELEAAIEYTAEREGWTRERIKKAMGDMARTYDLSGAYYITVYNKNLKSGYPGYADSFEKHLALRDHSGREVRAYLPGELEDSKFITSRVSAAGKEMNPAFLYEVGLTVAFRRKGLADKPEGLQLVLYDIGAVPMRVLTWDLSGIGSLTFLSADNRRISDS